MGNRCEYVDPLSNFPCGKSTTLGKITIQHPSKKEIITKFVCKAHGDRRFDYLSIEEIKLQKQKVQNKITSWEEWKDSMKATRWKKCRRCHGHFDETDIVCIMEYFYWTETRIGLRRSFLLHEDCCNSELKLFEVLSEPGAENTKLDTF